MCIRDRVWGVLRIVNLAHGALIMLGGYGTVSGPLLGAFLYEELRGYLLTSPTISQLQLVIAGALLLAMVLFAPGGLVGFIHQRWPRSRTILQ